jgi:hypothetical protein
MTLETMMPVDNETLSDEQNTSSNEIGEEERKEVKKILEKFFQWKKYRTRYDKNWMDYYKYFRGIQWSQKRPYWRSSEVVNFIWQTIQSQVPLQTDVRPTWKYLPNEPQDMEFAEILNSVSESDFNRKNWLRQLLEIIYDGWIFGTSYGSMKFVASEDYGIGSNVFKSEDLFYIYPDPDCNNINDPDSHGLFFARPVRTEIVKSWVKDPERRKSIKPDITDWVKKEKTDLKDFRLTYFNSDRQMPEGNYGEANNVSDIKKTLVIEGYLKPIEAVEEKEEDDNGNTTFIVKKKYPRGRHIKIANGMLILDEDLEDDDLNIPFAKYNNYILPHEFYGVSEVEPLEGLQRIFNKIVCFTLDAYALTGNPIWIVDEDSGVDTDSGFVNIPGSIVEKAPGSEVRRVEGAAITSGALSLIDRLESWFNKIGGISDLQSGEAPGGVTASSAIEQLIAIQRTRIRQKQRNMDEFLKDAGTLYMNRVLQYYSAPKIYRITGDDGSTIFRKFSIEKRPNDNGGVDNVGIIQDTVVGKDKKPAEQPSREMILKGMFDVEVKSGSSLPFEAADKERKTFALFDRQLIDEEEVFERLDIPNKEEILMRLKQRQQQAAQAAQQQG